MKGKRDAIDRPNPQYSVRTPANSIVNEANKHKEPEQERSEKKKRKKKRV